MVAALLLAGLLEGALLLLLAALLLAGLLVDGTFWLIWLIDGHSTCSTTMTTVTCLHIHIHSS